MLGAQESTDHIKSQHDNTKFIQNVKIYPFYLFFLILLWLFSFSKKVEIGKLRLLIWIHLWINQQAVFRMRSIKKHVLTNLSKFTRKHICWNLFLIKLQALRPSTFTVQKMKFSIQVFSSKCDQIRRFVLFK